MKKILSLCFAAAFLIISLSVLVQPALAATTGTCGENLTWTLDENGCLTISGTGNMYDYDLNAPWYPYCKNVKTAVIENGVTSIGSDAFYRCSNLTSVTIPAGVTSIGDNAFYICPSLTSVTIPDSVTSIGDSAFRSCSRLIGIWVDLNNTKYSSDDWGVLFNKEKTELLQMPGGKKGTYQIPDSVISIGDFSFSGCQLTSVMIPDSVSHIGRNAFMYCYGLTSITIPGSVTSMGILAFYESTNLTTVTIGDGATCIGDRAFENCFGLISVTIPDSVTSIGDDAFDECTSLTSVTIPDNVTSIRDGAFYKCTSLTEIVFTGDAPSFGSWVFANVVATAYFPNGNETWTSDVMQNYGGTITWVADEMPKCDNGHSYEAVVTKPTCTEDGYTTCTCTVCGDSYVGDYIDALGHVWDEGVVTKEPTADAEGVCTYTCTVCGDIKTVSISKTESNDVIYDLPDEGSVTIPENDCFESGTVVSVEKVEDGDTYETAAVVMEYVADQYTVFEITATKDNVSVQPDGVFVVIFDILEDYSNNIAVYYMTEDGTLERLEAVVDAENRTVTVELTHFSTYILADMDIQPEVSTLLGDVNGDGKVDTTDAKLIMQFDLGIVDETVLDLALADVNGDGKANTTDAKLIMQLDLGLIEQFP